MVESALEGRVDRLVERIAEQAGASGATIAVAESLTGGQLGAALAAAPESGTWFRGGVIAYHPEVKYSLLGAPRGPVVTEPTAIAMAESTARLLLADIVVAVTGVGGPEPDEGKPAGTVVLAVTGGGSPTAVEHLSFSGDPIEVMQQTVEAALEAVLARLSPGE
ncbi:CinA family protein [Leucobacter chromiiresistens]|uniref:Nicotinamide-nucleotide amidase n=1 Tax=Leucobacter chromiiresistens TaxID=1079994 RepID=A0A1H0ZE50_9MICO|nr:CinA family protein [Leucobacter chromiiresistens]SDQ25684.1 nicotinamide-nucleotide amidase [Leucobacter chromiiresistens]